MNTGVLNSLMLNGASAGSSEEIHVFTVPYGDMIITAPQGSVLNLQPEAHALSTATPNGDVLT